MGRIGGSASNPLTAAGDVVYGGSGSVTGYGGNKALMSLGVTPFSSGSGGAIEEARAFDADNGTRAVINGSDLAIGKYIGCLLPAVERIGRIRLVQGTQDANGRATSWAVESADALAGPWTSRYEHAALVSDSGLIDITPSSAIYWRVTNRSLTPVAWGVDTLELHAVSTVGAGNQTRLAAPTSKRHLAYDVANARPTWDAPQAANPDTAGATLAALETEVNELKAALRAAAILAP